MSVEDEKPLAVQFSTNDGDKKEGKVTSYLLALLDGSTTCSQAAYDFNALVVGEANQRLSTFQRRIGRARYEVSAEEASRGIDDIRTIGPYPEGKINELFGEIAKICSSFPPCHATQNLLIDFLNALWAIPAQQVPHLTPIWRLEESGSDAPGWNMMKLWPFEDAEGDLAYLIQSIFREEAEKVYSYDYSDIETLSSELRIRWRNFQSFCARLTVSGIADCTYICSLRDILPSSRQYPDLAVRKIGGPNRISADAVAGAQWIIWPEHGRWLYKRCKSHAPGLSAYEDPWGIFNLQGWLQWKKQFEWIEGDARFDAKSRVVAGLARSQMQVIEKTAA